MSRLQTMGLGLAVVILFVGAGPPEPADLADAYQKKRLEAASDAKSQVDLALWCERNGLVKERGEHLGKAIATDPNNATARGLLGQVLESGEWVNADRANPRFQEDPAKIALWSEYDARRKRASVWSVYDQLGLANWCEKHGMGIQARAHDFAVLRLDRNNKDARKQLGYHWNKDRWTTDEQLGIENQMIAAQRAADRLWGPRFEAWKRDLKSSLKRTDAAQEMTRVVDPRAVPTIWRVLARGDQDTQIWAARVLSQIPSGAATRALCVLALNGSSAETKKTAKQSLYRRDTREYVSLLISLVRPERDFENFIRYRVIPFGSGGNGSGGMVEVEGARYVAQTLFSVDEVLRGLDEAPLITYELGVPIVRRRQAAVLAELLELAVADAFQTEVEFDKIRAKSKAAIELLSDVTGHDFGPHPIAWSKWWINEIGYAYNGPEKEFSALDDSAPRPPKMVLTEQVVILLNPLFSCFGAGTVVHTLTGARRIEKVALGELVLTQNPIRGDLTFEPVLTVFHNKPAATLEIDLGGDLIVATGIHRFWKAGEGWAMARDLKVGDRIRMLDGITEIRSIKPAPVQPVFNLLVAANRSYVVGKRGALVHDNSLVETVAEPFDRERRP